MNVRALQVVVTELLRTLFDEDTTQNDMKTILQDLSNKSQFAKHWLQNTAPDDEVCLYRA